MARTIDLNDFRGFKVYTPELPATPEESLYDIKFWLSGVEDEATGLIRCDYYGGKDYTVGEWPFYEGIPLNFVGDALIGDFDASIKIPATQTGIKFPFIGNTSFSAGYSLGMWVTGAASADHSSAVDIRVDNTSGIGPLEAVFGYYGRGGSAKPYKLASQVLYDASTNPFFVQSSYKVSNKTCTITVNGAVVATQAMDGGDMYDFDYVRITGGGYEWGANANIIIISNDPDVDFYNTLYNGTRICNLTEYPKASTL
jgi:hypothetical protein